jgi:hypothetical protein
MKQKCNNIILKELSARLPYMVMVQVTGDWFYDELPPYNNVLTISKLKDYKDGKFILKPYLRSLDNMTEDERNELSKLLNYEFYVDDDCGLTAEDSRHRISLELMSIYINYLISHHFDYNGLIEKDLAIEAPGNMYTKFGDMDVDITVEYKGNKL